MFKIFKNYFHFKSQFLTIWKEGERERLANGRSDTIQILVINLMFQVYRWLFGNEHYSNKSSLRMAK